MLGAIFFGGSHVLSLTVSSPDLLLFNFATGVPVVALVVSTWDPVNVQVRCFYLHLQVSFAHTFAFF
jgi:hypothetical protein